MQQIYTCKFDNHDGEAIIGFCLNDQCKSPSQCCLQCVQEKHTTHQVDCKAFQNIKKIIDQQIDEKKMLEKNLIQLQENVKNQIDKILKETRQDVSKLQELDQKLKEQQYQEFKDNLEYIKQEYKIKKLNIMSETIRIMEVVNKFEMVWDKLKELLIENKKQTQDNVQINIEQAELFYKQGIKKFIQEINYKQQKYFNVNIYYQTNYVEAIKCFDQAILLDPKKVDAYIYKGVALTYIYNLII